MYYYRLFLMYATPKYYCSKCDTYFSNRNDVYIRSRQGKNSERVYYTCKECARNRQAERTPQTLERIKDRNTYRRVVSRLKAIKYLGGKCSSCGYDENLLALEFDHINNDGKKDREKKGSSDAMVRSIIKDQRTDIALLCANCHAIRTWSNFSKYSKYWQEVQLLESLSQA